MFLVTECLIFRAARFNSIVVSVATAGRSSVNKSSINLPLFCKIDFRVGSSASGSAVSCRVSKRSL